MRRSKFWMVLGVSVPVVKHATKETAFAEAERLAILNPGKEFFVLESLAACVKRDVHWEPTDESDPCDQIVPF